MKTKITAMILVSGALTTAMYADTALVPDFSTETPGRTSNAADQTNAASLQQSTVKQLILSDSRFNYSYKGGDETAFKRMSVAFPDDGYFQTESVSSRINIGMNTDFFVSGDRRDLTTFYPAVTLHFGFGEYHRS